MQFIFYRESFLILRLCFLQANILPMKNDRIKQILVLLSNQWWQCCFEHIQCTEHFTSNMERFKCNRSKIDL